jgi:hypothetical protein
MIQRDQGQLTLWAKSNGFVEWNSSQEKATLQYG